MKRIFIVLTLICICGCTGLAGEIPSVGAPAPQSQQASSPTLLGAIPTDGKAEAVLDAGLSAILTALGLAAF